MKDYALKYDASCQDVRGARISNDEYVCLRRNMDRVLDGMRQFVQVVQAAKTTDVAAQRDVVMKSLERLQSASASNYKGQCSSAIAIDPRSITFTKTNAVAWVEIGNHGNRDVTFSIDALPECFVAKPASVVRRSSRRS